MGFTHEYVLLSCHFYIHTLKEDHEVIPILTSLHTLTHPTQERLATPPGSTSLLFLKSGLSSFTSHKNLLLFLYFYFTSFSGHRPAQRECARTGLRSHARCHPYPIPQPVKVGHTTGVYDPYSFRIVMWVLLRPTRIFSVKVL